MSAMEYATSARGEVEIRVSGDAPEDLFSRMAEGDLPRALYGPMDRVEVFGHWVYNALRNGVTDVSDLDGWADMERGVVTMAVRHVDDFELHTAKAVTS